MSLADELMNDLMESDEEDTKEGLHNIAEDGEAGIDAMDFDDDEDNKDEVKRKLSNGDDDNDLSQFVIREIGDVKKLAQLVSSEAMTRVLASIDEYSNTPPKSRQIRVGNVEDDPEYQLVVEANSLSAELDQEIILVNKFIKDRYRSKFPELETLIRNPLDYAKTVRLIGNEMNVVKIDFTSVLAPASIMVVKTAATTTRGQPLSERELAIVLAACDMALNLDSAKRKILDYVQSRISVFAPNISALAGTQVAARLIGATGGLKKLAATPACNISTLGAKRAVGTGFALTHTEGSQGFLYHSEIIQRTARDYRRQAQRKVAAKIVLLARIDLQRESLDGSAGRKMRQDIDKALQKLQAPPEHRGPRALPAPLEPISKKRGGKRVRKAKEQNAVTEMRKLQNRMKFGEQEEEVGFGDETEGLGMLSQSGSFRALTVDNRTKAKLGKKMQARLGQISGLKTSLGKDSSGFQSSLSFTPVQGIELVNPSLNDAARESLVKSANDKWFSGGTFTQIQKPAAKKMLPPPFPKT